jgi:hypothetical protein
MARTSFSGHGDELLRSALLLLDDPIASANGLLRNSGRTMITQIERVLALNAANQTAVPA